MIMKDYVIKKNTVLEEDIVIDVDHFEIQDNVCVEILNSAKISCKTFVMGKQSVINGKGKSSVMLANPVSGFHAYRDRYGFSSGGGGQGGTHAGMGGLGGPGRGKPVRPNRLDYRVLRGSLHDDSQGESGTIGGNGYPSGGGGQQGLGGASIVIEASAMHLGYESCIDMSGSDGKEGQSSMYGSGGGGGGSGGKIHIITRHLIGRAALFFANGGNGGPGGRGEKTGSQGGGGGGGYIYLRCIPQMEMPMMRFWGGAGVFSGAEGHGIMEPIVNEPRTIHRTIDITLFEIGLDHFMAMVIDPVSQSRMKVHLLENIASNSDAEIERKILDKIHITHGLEVVSNGT